MSYYQITTPGKWILTGEHAVTKGHPAIVFPLPSVGLRLEYFDGKDELAIVGNEVLQDACMRALKRVTDPQALTGTLHLNCTIPVGAGLGSSAALCAALGNWLVSQGKIAPDEMLPNCIEMENEFHGQSSGTDIAAVLAGSPLWFEKDKPIQKMPINWQPKIFLSNSGISSSTSECIAEVNRYRESDANKNENVDEQMGNTAELMKFALGQNEANGFRGLAESIDIACLCFDRWGLLPEKVRGEIDRLKEAGAVAVKPTGSGNGGYLLSLWKNDPPADLNLLAGF